MNLHLPRNSKTTVQNPICAIIHINHVVWSLNRSPEAGWSISCIFLIIWQSEATKLLLLPKGSLKYRYQLKCVHFSTAQDNKNKDFEGKKKTLIHSLPELMGTGHKESCSTASTSQVLTELVHSTQAKVKWDSCQGNSTDRFHYKWSCLVSQPQTGREKLVSQAAGDSGQSCARAVALGWAGSCPDSALGASPSCQRLPEQELGCAESPPSCPAPVRVSGKWSPTGTFSAKRSSNAKYHTFIFSRNNHSCWWV